jgi:predicted Zn-dependent protease with MMP-like domain
MRLDWEKLHALAREEVEATLAALPAPLHERAQALPVTFERHPNAAHRRDGIEPDTLGLFVGPEFACEETTAEPLPPQIILFLENLWDLAEADEGFFREEVRTTYLHELGHYLGLDEDDLFDRGLE